MFLKDKGGQAINFIGEKGKEIKLDQVANQAKEGLTKAGTTIATGANDLKEHLIKQELTKKIFSFFGGKKSNEGVLDDKEPVATDEKKEVKESEPLDYNERL